MTARPAFDIDTRELVQTLRQQGAILPQETLDYLVTTKVVGSLEGQGGKGLADLRGVAIPVQLSGTFAEPKYKIRLDEALRGAAEKKVQEKIDKQKEKVQEKIEKEIGEQLNDRFKGIFGR